MWRTTRNYLSHAAGMRQTRWHPLLAVYYLSYRCDFLCPKCCDGSGTPYPQLRAAELPGPEVVQLLRVVRRYSDYLVITGGEPLKHTDAAQVLEKLPAIGYDGVIFTTNGYDVLPYLDALAASVQYLVFSLDTLDEGKADRWFGAGPGKLKRILDNIDAAARHPRRRYRITISSVALPDNISDLYEVYRFAKDRGFIFALCPVLEGVKAPASFTGNAEYRALFDHLIAEKLRGAPVHGSVAYLEHMRDLTKFTCRPSTVLAISPPGDVFYPCLERGTIAGNLLAMPDLDRIRADGIRTHGPEPSCDTRCHSACALGFALMLNRPRTLLHEAGVKALSLLRVRTAR